MTDSTLELVRIRRIFFFSEDMLRRCTPSCGASGDCATGAEGVGSGGTSCTGVFPSPADSVRGSRMFVSASSAVISFGCPSPPSTGWFLWVGVALTISGAELLTQDIQVVVMSAGPSSTFEDLRSECLVFRLCLCGGVDQHCHRGVLGSDSKVGATSW